MSQVYLYTEQTHVTFILRPNTQQYMVPDTQGQCWIKYFISNNTFGC